MKPGYTDSKTPAAVPPIESVAGYRTGKAPAGAAFEGFSTREGAANAADARREHSNQLSRGNTGPATPIQTPAVGK
jgi:hypothetical protein